MDLLSIDIDGNDIHVLDAIDVIRPRVVVIEYNGKFPPPMNVVQRYNPEHRWKGTDYGGSSLLAITKIAGRKGYSLVGCGIAGVNAFFVRDDLLGDKFQAPFTPENHYQPLVISSGRPLSLVMSQTGGPMRRCRTKIISGKPRACCNGHNRVSRIPQ